VVRADFFVWFVCFVFQLTASSTTRYLYYSITTAMEYCHL